jgi:hypothetical protein
MPSHLLSRQLRAWADQIQNGYLHYQATQGQTPFPTRVSQGMLQDVLVPSSIVLLAAGPTRQA